MAGYIGKITAGGTTRPIAQTLYGTCGTAAATAAKVVTCSDFDMLITGVTIHVKFTYSNTVASPTLNVNSTGAKTIYRYGTTAPSTSVATSWFAGQVVTFVYDGTYWQMVDWQANDNTTYTLSSITGTLAIAKGGTGLTASPSMLTNLASTSAANVLQASPRPGVTGTLPVSNGGTGATTFTSGAVLEGNGTGAVTAVAFLSDSDLITYINS